MVEYNNNFSRQMALAGSALLATSPESTDRDRAALYVSLVACEAALKSALEQAGRTVKDIRANSHNLSALLDQVSSCTILEVMPSGNSKRVSASRIKAIVVDGSYSNATIGYLISAEEIGASKFPNEVRYGSVLNHFPAEVMVELANKISSWVEAHSSDIQA
jgi:hypothetical protein